MTPSSLKAGLGTQRPAIPRAAKRKAGFVDVEQGVKKKIPKKSTRFWEDFVFFTNNSCFLVLNPKPYNVPKTQGMLFGSKLIGDLFQSKSLGCFCLFFWFLGAFFLILWMLGCL